MRCLPLCLLFGALMTVAACGGDPEKAPVVRTSLQVKRTVSSGFTDNEEFELTAGLPGRLRITLRDTSLPEQKLNFGTGLGQGVNSSASGVGFSLCERDVTKDDIGRPIRLGLDFATRKGKQVLDQDVASMFGKEHAAAIRKAVPGADDRTAARIRMTLSGQAADGKRWQTPLAWNSLFMPSVSVAQRGWRDEVSIPSGKRYGAGYMSFASRLLGDHSVNVYYTGEKTTVNAPDFKGKILLLEIAWKAAEP